MALKMKTMDGNTAAALASYAFTEVSAIYPITPSSVMSEHMDEWASENKKNIFGQTVNVVQMQSEAGAAGTVHGSLVAGALTTTYTSSQGLLLMIPNMYKMAGELLPAVLHVSARTVAAHALSIFGDHSDVMAVRQTGFAMLASSNVQECLDLAAISHLSAIRGRVPFVHFLDGFRTSSEIQKIEVWDYDDVEDLIDKDALERFRRTAMNPEHPDVRGMAQNPDIFFQARESANKFYEAVPAIVEGYMEEFNKRFNRNYKLFKYYGAPDAERVIVAMGSVCDAAMEVVDYLTEMGEKVGLVNVHLFRPFVPEKLLEAIPATAKKIAVLDRCKEPGAIGEPLYTEICTAFFETARAQQPIIVGGRYGLSSKDVTPAQLIAVFDNLKGESPKNHFTIGITDDVTFHSLHVGSEVDMASAQTLSCKFWGLGSDGTVGANKNSIKIIGDHTDLYVQAYFAYDSKKSGGITTSHLRFGNKPIRSSYLVSRADFVACHNSSYLEKYDMLEDLKDSGAFLLNCHWSEEELEGNLPPKFKKELAQRGIRLYTIDASEIAKHIGLGGRTNSVLQAAFFKLAEVIPVEEAVSFMKEAVESTYRAKGQKVLDMNFQAIDQGINNIVRIEVPAAWADIVVGDDTVKPVLEEAPEFITKVVEPINALKGDLLPVSAFEGREDGKFPTGTSAFERRAIATEVPVWIPENCIQCNQCAYVCPHATIRPFLLDEEEAENSRFKTLKAIGKGTDGLQYRIQVDTMDCVGCGVCAQVCPAKNKALVMTPIETQLGEMENWDYCMSLAKKENPVNKETVKGSQFEQPLLQFSGACAGCGETPYAKLVTQLFGDRMYIANATGCSSIWGASSPSTPYAANEEGKGPAWANSLFEDNAEFGYGIYLGANHIREGLVPKLKRFSELTNCGGCREAALEWIDRRDDSKTSKAASEKLVAALNRCGSGGEAREIADDVLRNRDHLVKKSFWIFGGDGWAYDKGFGGLDHVIASGENVNILIFDTEVYSNTGGQSSKATPTGAIAKFAASGKRTRKKDLGLMAMSYGYVYVAQVAMGANYNQTIKALVEAEAYDGPSIVIAYSPCIAHGYTGGMMNAQMASKRAVESGYWNLYRYNPMLEQESKNPFVLDFQEPTLDFQEYLAGEVRFNSMRLAYGAEADEVFKVAEAETKRRLEIYKKLAAW